MITMNSALEKATQNGYLTLTKALCEAYPEVVEQTRYLWRANRLHRRLPYIEIHPRPEKQAFLVYDVGHVPHVEEPAKQLVEDLQRQIASIQHKGGGEVQCFVRQTEPYRVVMGELPMSNAIEVAAAIMSMALPAPEVA